MLLALYEKCNSQHVLNSTTLWANSTDDKCIFSYFLQQISFGICKLSPKETICMKDQSLSRLNPEENSRNSFKLSSAENFTQHTKF